MAEEERKRNCSDNGSIYQHGYGFCKDVYCIECVDGTLEMHPHIGAIMDLSEVW